VQFVAHTQKYMQKLACIFLHAKGSGFNALLVLECFANWHNNCDYIDEETNRFGGVTWKRT